MNTDIRRQEVLITHSGCAPTSGHVDIAYWTSRERAMHMVKYWGLCWLAAIGSVFIPVAHFVLVPSCLLLGPIVGILKWRQKSQIIGGSGHCPNCQAELVLHKYSNCWPLGDACPACKRNLQIEKQ